MREKYINRLRPADFEGEREEGRERERERDNRGNAVEPSFTDRETQQLPEPTEGSEFTSSEFRTAVCGDGATEGGGRRVEGRGSVFC